jgi:hypothetical protein
VVDVYRIQQAALNASTAAAARDVYQKAEKAAEQALASAIAAVTAYEASHPVKAGQAQPADPELAALQHEVDLAQGEIDKDKQRLGNIDLVEQTWNGMVISMSLVDGPTIEKGLFGIRGLRSDNLKTDGIAAAAGAAAAAIYVLLIAFLDHTIRHPDELKRRYSTKVVTVPEYHARARARAGAPDKVKS